MHHGSLSDGPSSNDSEESGDDDKWYPQKRHESEDRRKRYDRETRNPRQGNHSPPKELRGHKENGDGDNGKRGLGITGLIRAFVGKDAFTVS